MTDEQLVNTAKIDGTSITYEAFIILKREFKKRNLAAELIIEIDKKRQEDIAGKVQNIREREEILINNILWKEIIRQIAEGRTKSEILDWLVNKGIDPEIAFLNLKNSVNIISALYSKAKLAMAVSFLFLFIGGAICIASIESSISRKFLFYGIVILASTLSYIGMNHQFYRLCEKAKKQIDAEQVV